MSPEKILNISEIVTLIAAFFTIILTFRDIYEITENLRYKFKIITIVISAITFLSALTTSHYSGVVSGEKDREFANYKIGVSDTLKIAEERISLNERLTAEALAKSDSFNAQLRLSQLNIEKTRLGQVKLKLRTLELEKNNLELSLKLRQEENKRMELLNSLAPRSFEQLEFSNYIKKYKNINIILECVADEEAIETLDQLNFIFGMANWKILSTNIIAKSPMIRDGISVHRNVGALPEDEQADKAANALLSQLKLNEIDANFYPTSDLPPNTIKVIIGKKPDTYIKNWISEQISIRMTKLDSVKMLMKRFNADKNSFLLNKYPLGFILFTIDEKRNIIPSTSELTQVLDFNWDNAGFQDWYMNKDMFQLPKITHIQTKEVLLYQFESVKIEKNQTLVKEIDEFGRFLFKSNIRMFFEVIEWNKYGVLCLIGYKN